MIPLFATSLDAVMPAVIERLSEVAAGGRYILGPEVERFERAFADYIGVDHCIGVANGTDAITIALRALGVGEGDEVVVPSLTFYATAEATVNAGATPVFADVDRDTWCITADTVRPVLTERTKAIMPVHLFGNVAPVADLVELGLPVLEDAAQAAGASLNGAKAGALGDAATFSFFPSKNLGGLGDGGAVVTSDDEVAAFARRLRFHGSEDKATFTEVGYNSRLDALQAAALGVMLPELDAWNEARRRVADGYERAGLGDVVKLPQATEDTTHVFHLYVITHPRGDELAAFLTEREIGARGYYRTPVHRQPAMAPWANGVELPVTEEVASTHVALPMGPLLEDEQIEEVVAACREFASSQA